MPKNPVDLKSLAIETRLGYINIYLEHLFNAMKENNQDKIDFQKSKLKKLHYELQKLGHFK